MKQILKAMINKVFSKEKSLALSNIEQPSSSSITFSQRLKQTFTVRKFISIIFAALFGYFLRMSIIHCFPDLAWDDLALIFPPILGSMIAREIGGSCYDHLLGVGQPKGNKGLEDMDFSKVLMNNSGSNSNRGTFTNTIPEISNPVEVNLQHGTRRLNYAQLQALNNQAQALGVFTISNINITNKSCTVEFHKPVPDLNNRAEADLYKRLFQMFPNSENYSSSVKRPCVLDDHRLQGCIRSNLDRGLANPNSIYISDQNKPQTMSPRYNPYAAPGFYQPWASDIADNMMRSRAANGTVSNNGINLDLNSTIFLLSFANAHPQLNPSDLTTGPVISSLRNL